MEGIFLQGLGYSFSVIACRSGTDSTYVKGWMATTVFFLLQNQQQLCAFFEGVEVLKRSYLNQQSAGQAKGITSSWDLLRTSILSIGIDWLIDVVDLPPVLFTKDHIFVALPSNGNFCRKFEHRDLFTG